MSITTQTQRCSSTTVHRSKSSEFDRQLGRDEGGWDVVEAGSEPDSVS